MISGEETNNIAETWEGTRGITEERKEKKQYLI